MPETGSYERTGEMPKERIQSCTTSQFDVIVAWNRDGTVQVATTASDADERLRNWTESSPAGSPLAQPETQPGTSFRHFGGWHVDLGRQQINELIRVLRRARDQAFGRDE